MADAQRDGNYVPTIIGVSSVDLVTPVLVAVNPATGAVLIDLAGGGSGTVTDVSVVSANGFAGTVATSTTTPAITLSTTISGILKGNGTAISAATAGTDYTALAFKTIVVAGQSDIVADSAADTLTIAAGTGITLTTNATTDTLTIALTTDPAGYANTALSNLASVAINTSLLPGLDDGAALGNATHNFSDLFLATGALINFANGNAVITHSSGVLTVSTGDLRVTTAGTNAASVVTVAGSQNLSNKVLTAATITTSLVPTTNDGAPLGDTTHQFSDLFLAEGGVINWDNGDATITQTNNVIAIAGITDLTVSGNVTPAANDGGQLGSATVSWADLFLASGAVINIANGNWVATHTSGILTVTTGDLRVTSANVGTNADSVPTLSSTSTLTNKTLTSPTITTGSYSGDQVLQENATVQLDPSLSADGKYTGITIVGTAGATVSFGDLLYLASTGKWVKAKADAASTSGGVLLGFALGSSTDTNPVTLLLNGNIRADAAFPTFTVGAPTYISAATAGVVTGTQPSSTDQVIRVIGFALTADSLMFNPSPDYITHT